MNSRRPSHPTRLRNTPLEARITPNAVYEMVRRGELLAVRFGRAICIPRDAGDKKLTGEAA